MNGHQNVISAYLWVIQLGVNFQSFCYVYMLIYNKKKLFTSGFII